MMMMIIMMMVMTVQVLGTKVPLFSKVNQNSGSRTFAALLMVMMMIARKNMKRIIATLMKSNAAANDDAIVNQISRSWAPFALFS